MIIANDNLPAHAVCMSVFHCDVYKGIMISVREHLSASGGPWRSLLWVPGLIKSDGGGAVSVQWHQIIVWLVQESSRRHTHCPQIPIDFQYTEDFVGILVFSELEMKTIMEHFQRPNTFVMPSTVPAVLVYLECKSNATLTSNIFRMVHTTGLGAKFRSRFEFGSS